MTYTVSNGTLNSTIPYHTADNPRDAFVQTILLIWPEMVLNSTSGQNTVVVVVVVVVVVYSSSSGNSSSGGCSSSSSSNSSSRITFVNLSEVLFK